MIVRHAGARDLHVLAEMGFRFFEAGQLPGKFRPEAFIGFWKDALSTDVGIVLVLEHGGEVVGTLGALVYTDPCTGDKVSQEMFWWVDEAHRGQHSVMLIEAFEYVAHERGAQRLMMSAVTGLKDRALARWYGARGYRPLEHSYVKEV